MHIGSVGPPAGEQPYQTRVQSSVSCAHPKISNDVPPTRLKKPVFLWCPHMVP